jgi:hypothetical protein
MTEQLPVPFEKLVESSYSSESNKVSPRTFQTGLVARQFRFQNGKWRISSVPFIGPYCKYYTDVNLSLYLTKSHAMKT